MEKTEKKSFSEKNEGDKDLRTERSVSKSHKVVLLITRTAVILAVTLVLQFMSKSFGMGNPIATVIITGTLVNMCMFLSATTVGLIGSAVVCVATPSVAFATGHLAFAQLIPFIAISNYVIIIGFWLMMRYTKKNWLFFSIAIVIVSVVKFLVMYAGVLQLAPFLGIPPKALLALQFNYSWPQLVTALAGGVVSVPILMALRYARIIK